MHYFIRKFNNIKLCILLKKKRFFYIIHVFKNNVSPYEIYRYSSLLLIIWPKVPWLKCNSFFSHFCYVTSNISRIHVSGKSKFLILWQDADTSNIRRGDVSVKRESDHNVTKNDASCCSSLWLWQFWMSWASQWRQIDWVWYCDYHPIYNVYDRHRGFK